MAALAALVIALAAAACGDDGSGAGNEPAPAGNEPAPAGAELPADLQACLEEQGLDVSGGIPHGPELHEYLEACGQYLPEGGPPGGSPMAP